MKRMKQLFYLGMSLFTAAMALTGCEKIKDKMSTEFTVDNVRFDFSAVTTEGMKTMATETTTATESKSSDAPDYDIAIPPSLRSATTNTFTETRTVNLSEIGSSDVVEYAGKISDVKVAGSQIKITATPAGNYSFTNLTLSAGGVPGALIVPLYVIGEPFTPPADIDAYTAAFILKLLGVKSLSVTVTGLTDAPAGTTIRISYENNLIFTASLL
jgi:hypothetical protein